MDAERSPPRKILKTTQPSEKLCVVCNRTGPADEHEDDEGVQIFIVDLDGAGNTEATPKAPALIIGGKCLFTRTFCLIDSTLYLFGFTEKRDFRTGYTYEFPPNISHFHRKRLETRDLRRIPDMNYNKYHPFTIATPDKKHVLAFSSAIPMYNVKEPSDYFDFELYDPSTEMWNELPNIPSEWRFAASNISGYSFLDDKTFLLRTEKIGVFTLDLTPPFKWQKDCSLMSLPMAGCGPSIYIEGNFFLARRCGFDGRCVFCYPNMPLCLYYNIIVSQGPVALLDADRERWKSDADGGKWRFCVARTEIDREGTCPRLMVNVCELDMLKYREEKKEMKEEEIPDNTPLPATTILKSFEFDLEPDVFPELFGAVGLFPFR